MITPTLRCTVLLIAALLAVACAADDAKPKPPRVRVEVKLVERPLPALMDSVPYKSAYAVYSYDVVRTLEGTMPYTQITVAHWVWRDRRMVTAADKQRGQTYTLKLVPFDQNPELVTEQVANELPEDFTNKPEASFYDVAPLVFVDAVPAAPAP